MADAIDNWLAQCPDLEQDPLPGMRATGLLAPVADYAAIARGKAALVARTGRLGIGSVWGGQQLVFRHFVDGFGSAAQRAEWSGRALSVAISEPRVGAHPKLLSTRAEPDAAGFRISGQKAWVSNAPSADGIIVFAITAEQQGRKRYSAFVVPRGTAGLSMTDMVAAEMPGAATPGAATPGFDALRPSRHCRLTLDGCVVPAAAMLGEAGTAYERMALPFRDIEDAVGTFATLGALRHAVGLFAGTAEVAAGPRRAGELGAAERGAAEPGAAERGAAELGAAERGAAEPGAAERGAAEPGAAERGAAEPGAAERGAAEPGAAELGAILGLTAVFHSGAEAVVAGLDAGRLRSGDATLVGLRVLALDLAARLRRQAETAAPGRGHALIALLADLDAALAIARGPRLARQTRLGEAALVAGTAAA